MMRKSGSHGRRLGWEALEGRALLAGVIAEYPTLTPGANPLEIAPGPDGALWFTELAANKIGRITTGGAMTEFSLPTPGSSPGGIAAGPDGAMWFTESSGIGRISTGGAVTEYPLPTPGAAPRDIAAGPDGALWFTEATGIGRITTGGEITEFPLPNPGRSPGGIAVGSDGALWFTLFPSEPSRIGRITTEGVITEFAPALTGGNPIDIAAGPDGALWFTQDSFNRVGRITTEGAATEFQTSTFITSGSVGFDFPIYTASLLLGRITAEPGGNLWYTKSGGLGSFPGVIGRITTAGLVDEYLIPTLGAGPTGIADGPDGDIWFTEFGASKIGRLSPRAPAPTSVRLLADVNPSPVGQPVTFTTYVSPAQGGSTPTGVVDFSIDGGPVASVPLTGLNQYMRASLTVATLGPGTHQIVATYGGSTELLPGSATLSVEILAPLTVTSLNRLGFHEDPTRIVIGFSSELDPTRAEDVRNYRISGPGGRAIPIGRAVYSPSSKTVVLTPRQRLDLHVLYRLRVIGSGPDGIADTSGNLLDGTGDGHPGRNYFTYLTAADLILGADRPVGPDRRARFREALSAIEAKQAKQLVRLPHLSHVQTIKRGKSLL